MCKIKLVAVLGLLIVNSLLLVGIDTLAEEAEPGDAVVTINIQVDENGHVTGKTITPQVARIRGASEDGAGDGGRVIWKITSARRVQVYVEVNFGFSEGSPFEFNTFGAGPTIVGPGLPSSQLTSSPANVTRGRFRYRVQVTQGGRVVSGEGTVNVGETSVPMLGQWGTHRVGSGSRFLACLCDSPTPFRPGLASIGQAL